MNQRAHTHHLLCISWLGWIVFWVSLFTFFGMTYKVTALVTISNAWSVLVDLLIIIACIIFVSIAFIVSLLRQTSAVYFALGILFCVASALFLSEPLFPDDLIVDLIRGKPHRVAFYRGTQNVSRLTLRQNGKIDIWATGWPGTGHWYMGTYTIEKGKVICSFTGEAPAYGNIGILSDDTLTFGSKDRPLEFRIRKPPTP